MKAIDEPFTKIIQGTKQFVIPVFQRDYNWTESHCEQLWNDILKVASCESDRGHFIGSVVYVATGSSSAGFNQWLLIDGQQRVTTLTLLLTALRDHIDETGWKGNEDDPTVKRINAYFLKNTEEEGGRKQKLVLRRHDQLTLKALINGVEPPEKPSQAISDNYQFFRDQLASSNPSDIYQGIGRLVVVDVTLHRGVDDPQLVFESLNSTGLDLSQSDLIRNFILMRLPEKDQTRLYEDYWSKIENLFRGSEKSFDAFVRDYLALKTRANKQEKAKQIYQAFRKHFEKLVQEIGGLEKFLSEMLRFARYYAAFSVNGDAYPILADELTRLRRLVDVPSTLVMALFDCYEREESLTEQQFLEALCLLQSYIFRRAICGAQTRGYWLVFANLAYRIDQEKPLESLKVAIVRQRDSYRFPNDDEFTRELQQRDLFGLRVCNYMLERLENHGSKEKTDTSGYSIEHVLPQNKKMPKAWRDMLGGDWKAIHEVWVHRLGNLTLTGYNSTYSDRPFDEKKKIKNGFSDSSVRLNKYVREQTKWTVAEIEKRGSILAKEALHIWPPLIVDAAAIEAAKIAELKEREARQDLSKVQMSAKAKALFEILQPRLRELEPDLMELAEYKSVSYHAPSFFLEVLPRNNRLVLLFPLIHSEVEDINNVCTDESDRTFFFYCQYEGGVSVLVKKAEDIETAIPIIQQALAQANK